jgi:Anti-sigma factor NepR
MARRPNALSAFKAARIAIGAELGRLFSDVLREPIPDGMAELLRQSDKPIENGRHADDA